MLVLGGGAIRDPRPLPETHQRITTHVKGPGGLAKPFLFLYRIRKISQWYRGVFPLQFSHSSVPMEFLFQYKSRQLKNTQHKHSQFWEFLEIKGRPTCPLQLPGLWSSSYGTWQWWLLFSHLQVVVMLNKYFSIFQQWIELGVYYLAFNLGGSEISSEDKYIFQLCPERQFPRIFYSWEVPRREPKAREKMRIWNQLVQIQCHWLSSAGDGRDVAKELKFILSALVHLPSTAQGKYPSQFASRYSIHRFPWQLQ